MPPTAPGVRATPHTTDQWVGRVIAQKYRLEEKIAEGGMGLVYRARHINLQSHRAIKLLKADWRSSPKLRERFEQEIRTTHMVSHKSQHIVTIYDDYGFIEGCGYYVMELLEGELLSRRIAAHPQGLPLAQVLSHALQLCAALQVVHQHKIVHRDLKPDNLFLAQGAQHEELKLLDFGIAKVMEPSAFSTDSLHFFGTLPYMAPELLEAPTTTSQEEAAQSVDQRADLYALGCILFELLAGHPPFPMDSPKTPAAATRVIQAHISEKPPPLQKQRADLPRPLYQLVQRLLAKSPEDRPDSAETVTRTLLAIQSDTALVEASGRFAIDSPPSLASVVSRLTKALAVTVLLLSLAFGIQYIWQERGAVADSHDPTTKRPAQPTPPQPRPRRAKTPKRPPAPRPKAAPTPAAPRLRPHVKARIVHKPKTHRPPARRRDKPQARATFRTWTVNIRPAGYLRHHRLQLPPGVQRRGQQLFISQSIRRASIIVFHRHQKGYEPCTFTLHHPQRECTLKPLSREGAAMVLNDYCVTQPGPHTTKKD